MTSRMQNAERGREEKREGGKKGMTVRGTVTQCPNKECENKASALAGCRLVLKSHCAEKKQQGLMGPQSHGTRVSC